MTPPNDRHDKGHRWTGVTQPGTDSYPTEHLAICDVCGVERGGSDDDIPTCDSFNIDAVHRWFGLSYAQFLTIPRVVMQSMPGEWQTKMVALLKELDATFDWRPEHAQYWVRVKGEDGRLRAPDADICDYRHGSVEHLRINTPDEGVGS